MLIDKSKFVLSGFLPMTDQESEAFDMSNPTRTIKILGREYVICELVRCSDGKFTATLMAPSKIKISFGEQS